MGVGGDVCAAEDADIAAVTMRATAAEDARGMSTIGITSKEESPCIASGVQPTIRAQGGVRVDVRIP